MSLMQQSAAITFVLVLLWVALWWLKRKGAVTGRLRLNDAMREMEIVQRMALTPHHSLHLIRMKERTLLIAVHPGGLSVIRDLESHQS
jgi:flagellar biogenesis protein FliO